MPSRGGRSRISAVDLAEIAGGTVEFGEAPLERGALLAEQINIELFSGDERADDGTQLAFNLLAVGSGEGDLGLERLQGFEDAGLKAVFCFLKLFHAVPRGSPNGLSFRTGELVPLPIEFQQ